MALHGSYTTLDYFNDLNRTVYEQKIEPFYQKQPIFHLPTCEADVTKNTLKNTIICALGHRGTKSGKLFIFTVNVLNVNCNQFFCFAK